MNAMVESVMNIISWSVKLQKPTSTEWYDEESSLRRCQCGCDDDDGEAHHCNGQCEGQCACKPGAHISVGKKRNCNKCQHHQVGVNISLPSTLMSEASIRLYHTAGGVLAMAKIATDLIQLGRDGHTWTLLLDAGTMRAGDQYQAAVASYPIEERGVQVMKRFVIGVIPMRDGTYSHRTERIMTIFDDLLEAAIALPFFWSSPGEACKPITVKDMLRGCNSFLGDHGEFGVMKSVCACFVNNGYGDPALAQAGATRLPWASAPPMIFFFCHFHKLINFLAAGAAGMALLEPNTSEKLSSEIAALDLLGEWDGKMLGVFAVASRFRRVGEPSAYCVIWDVCKLVGAKIGAHESLWKGKESKALVAYAAIAGLTDANWASMRNARGDQSYFENAGYVLLLMLQKGPGGLDYLIQALIQKRGNSNNLLDAIRDVCSNVLVMAQLAVMCVFHHCVFAPFRAMSGQRDQFGCLDIDIPLLKLMENLHTNPVGLDQLPWVDRGDFTLIEYMEGVRRTSKTGQMLELMLKPPGLEADDLALFYSTSREMIKGLAGGTMGKAHKMLGEDYGDLKFVNTWAKQYNPSVHPSTHRAMEQGEVPHPIPHFQQTSKPAQQLQMMSGVEGSAIAVERTFGILDDYIRSNPTMTKLRVSLYLLIRDQHIGVYLNDYDDEILEEMVRAAYTYGKKLDATWKGREKSDEAKLTAFLLALGLKAQEKAQDKAEKLRLLKKLESEWSYDPAELEAQMNKTQAKRREWMVERCVHGTGD